MVRIPFLEGLKPDCLIYSSEPVSSNMKLNAMKYWRMGEAFLEQKNRMVLVIENKSSPLNLEYLSNSAQFLRDPRARFSKEF